MFAISASFAPGEMNIIKTELAGQGPEFFSDLHFSVPATVRDQGQAPAFVLQRDEGIYVLLGYATSQSHCVVPVNGNPFGRFLPPNSSTSAHSGQVPLALQFVPWVQVKGFHLLTWHKRRVCSWCLFVTGTTALAGLWFSFVKRTLSCLGRSSFCSLLSKEPRPSLFLAFLDPEELLEELLLLLMFQSGGLSTPAVFLASLSCSPFPASFFWLPFFL